MPLFALAFAQPLPPTESALRRSCGCLGRRRFWSQRELPGAVALKGFVGRGRHRVAIDFSQVPSLLVVVAGASMVYPARGHNSRATEHLNGGAVYRQHHAVQAAHGSPAQPVALGSCSLQATRSVVYLPFFDLGLPFRLEFFTVWFFPCVLLLLCLLRLLFLLFLPLLLRLLLLLVLLSVIRLFRLLILILLLLLLLLLLLILRLLLVLLLRLP